MNVIASIKHSDQCRHGHAQQMAAESCDHHHHSGLHPNSMGRGTYPAPNPVPPPSTAIQVRAGKRPSHAFLPPVSQSQVSEDLASTEPSPLREPQRHQSLTLGTMPLTSRLGLSGRRQEPLRVKNCLTSSRPERRMP